MKPRLYALVRAVEPATGDRKLVTAMVVIAAMVTGLALHRVSTRHQLVALGYQLTRASDELRHERELNRRLELERATLTNPERIRALASELGMISVPPDHIRVIAAPAGAR
ncbi:MAG: cell division protein FtsL [Kofleriaceae bacterium]|jgi:cell division protein FtsL|nr:cell division protein FtsL [Kofleriaceae bacterium]MBP9167291.1 cell division protein FtsL [Kofleriaceae bacterium]MBP9861633.1 cell division protein FtsL [Kofleriaceae bacterium]